MFKKALSSSVLRHSSIVQPKNLANTHSRFFSSNQICQKTTATLFPGHGIGMLICIYGWRMLCTFSGWFGKLFNHFDVFNNLDVVVISMKILDCLQWLFIFQHTFILMMVGWMERIQQINILNDHEQNHDQQHRS